MSGGNYSHTTRATGTVLTAAIYNADHTNHITNQSPQGTGGYSDSVSQMQTKTSPGGIGSESLTTSMAGELERIRFQLNAIIGGAQWYASPPTTLTALAGASVPDDSITNLKLANMAAGTIKARNIGIGTGDPADLTLTQVLDFVGSAANGDLLFRTGGVWNRLAIGSNGQFFQVTAGAPAWGAAPTVAVKAADRQVFTSSGTWTKPSGFGTKAFAIIEIWGAGGGGGRALAGAGKVGGGGGGGGFNRVIKLLSALGSSETVTLGAGGAGATVNDTNGSVGGNSTFGAHATGYGGGGGGGGTTGGGCCPTKTGGYGGWPNRVGVTGDSTVGVANSNTSVSISGKFYNSSDMAGSQGGGHTSGTITDGADSVWGGAGGAPRLNVTNGNPGTGVIGGSGGAAGSAGSQPGGGGGGNTSANGGAGGTGQIVVTVIDGA